MGQELSSVKCYPTDRMCNVILLARHAAESRGAQEITTLDILDGIVEEASGVAAHILRSQDIFSSKPTRVPWTVDAGREELASLAGEARVMIARAEQMSRLHRNEASGQAFRWYGTEHVLLAILDGAEETGTRWLLEKLTAAGLTLDDLKQRLLNLLRDG